MKIRPALLAILFALVAFAFAGPATAQANVPGVKTTAEYKALNNFVIELQSNRNTPATAAKKTNYRTRLAARRSAANTKVNSLYVRRILIIASRDNKKQRKVVKKIRQNQKRDVITLKATAIDKVNILQAKQSAAISRAKAPFQVRINRFSNKRAILAKRLSKTTNPVRRIRIQNKISSIQVKINALVSDSISAANAASSRYDTLIINLNARYKAKIETVKARSLRLIKQANQAYKRLFREKINNVKTLRTNEFQVVTNLRDRGAGFIVDMPLVP